MKDHFISILFGALLGYAFNIFEGIEMSYVSHILAFIGLSGLNAHIRVLKATLRPYLKTTYFFGLAFHTVSLFWVGQALTFAQYTLGVDLSYCSYFASFAIALILAVQFPVAFKIGGTRFWIIPFLLMDFMRSYSSTFFPWNFIGYTGTLWLSSFRFWRVFGSTAFLLILSQWQNYPKKGKMILGSLSALLILDHFFYQKKTFDWYPYSIKVIQTNSGLKDRNFVRNFNTLVTLTLKGEKTDLIVWPESSVLMCLHSVPYLRQTIASLIPQNSYIILGHIRLDNLLKFYVALSVLNHKGEIISTYAKQKLVPFGEYTPFLLNIPKLTAGKKAFTPGCAHQSLCSTALGDVIPLICYETAFPFLLHGSLAHKKAAMIVGISNDIWFGKSCGPFQHLHLARCRAIEAGKPFIRSVNAGISGLIAPNGKIVSYISFQKEDSLIIKKIPIKLKPT